MFFIIIKIDNRFYIINIVLIIFIILILIVKLNIFLKKMVLKILNQSFRFSYINK